MSNLNDIMYTTIPAVALLCNVFLFSTLLTAKKDKQVYALMLLLFTFILWTGGSLFMRMGMLPSMSFWWKVSLTGIFLVPYAYFLVASAYSEAKGYIAKIVFLIMTIIIAVLNLFDFFLTSPEVVNNNGHEMVHYSATTWAVLPVIVATIIIGCTFFLFRRSVKVYGMSMNSLTPFVIGLIAMVVGCFLDIIPVFNSLPMDTLGCAINACCMYYAFYKKRVYSLHQVTSSGGMFFVTLMIMAFAVKPIFYVFDTIVEKAGMKPTMGMYVLVAVVCAGIAIIVFILLNKLHEKVFVKEQNRREDKVKEFSTRVNSTLKYEDVLNCFLDLCKNEIDAEHVYLCMLTDKNDQYASVNGLDTLEDDIVIQKSNPIIEQLEKQKTGILYSDFARSRHYKSMWEDEKQEMESHNIEFILPFVDDEQVLGFALLTNKQGDKSYSYAEINFLDSVASVAAIALKNAKMYAYMEKEAQLDSMTNLYNRRAFNNKLKEYVEDKSMSPISLAMFNLDDFGLYNELYGNSAGDQALSEFAEVLIGVFGSSAVLARYGGKEFAALMPCTDADTAENYANRVKMAHIERMNECKDKTKKELTFSGAVCSYPSVATNSNELITFVNLGVDHVKHNGKDQIVLYHKDFKTNDAKDKKEHIYELASTIYALTAAIDAKDHYTFNHSRCVSEYATKLAEFAGLPSDYVEIVRQAGLLHDIGKISIPDAILTKNGRLTDEEYAVMKQHPMRSVEMIRHLPSLDYVIPAVIGHHERYDGGGYPRGVAGEDIPIGARCLAVADSFDAMVSKRSYKDKLSTEFACGEILKNLGTQFDPELGRLFVEKIQSGEIEVIEY